MAKKKAAKKSTKYQTLKLHGNYPMEKVFLYSLLVLGVSFGLSLVFLGQVVQTWAYAY